MIFVNSMLEEGIVILLAMNCLIWGSRFWFWKSGREMSRMRVKNIWKFRRQASFSSFWVWVCSVFRFGVGEFCLRVGEALEQLFRQIILFGGSLLQILQFLY